MAEGGTVITLSVKPVVDTQALRKALADELRRLATDIESPKPSVNFAGTQIGTLINA